MTMNIAATVWNLLVWAFYIVVVIGVAIGAYAAVSLKKAEAERKQ